MKSLIGQQFGRYSVVAYSGKRARYHMWHCVCSCGNSKILRHDFLVSGRAKSCGCLLLETNQEQHHSKMVERFHSSYTTIAECGCWIWDRSCDKGGYGWFAFERSKTGKAHRASWFIHFGPIPDGLCVLHRCDNPSCVNPHHLFLGTNTENNIDKVTKNRQAYGQRNGMAILNESQIKEIRNLYPDIGCAELARMYKMSNGAIQHIVKRRHWNHI